MRGGGVATIVTQEATSSWNGKSLFRLNRHSQRLLEELGLVSGVQGACLCDNHGGVLGMLLADGCNRRLFERVGLVLTQCLAALSGRSAVRDIELRLERKLVVARDLGNALIILLCSTDVNLPILRMALNVAADPLEADADLQRSLTQRAPARADTLSREHLDASTRLLLQRGGLRLS
jgi:hypothetical protein